ncbi:MAG: cobaltochelatase CobT-related protein [Acidiferrobacter sp.]
MRHTTRQALPIVASVIGQRLGIPVLVGGDQACTDGTRIIVPNVEDDAHKDVAYGYIVHEAAHIRYTNFEKHGESDLVHALANILEDVRIERAIAQEYPGAPSMIRKVIEHMVDTGLMKVTRDTPVGILCMHILFRLRGRVLRQECLDSLMHEQERVLRETFSEGVVVRLHGILAGADKTGSTAECVAMAKRILLMMHEEIKKAQERQSHASSAKQTGNGANQEIPSSGGSPSGANGAQDGSPQGSGAQGAQNKPAETVQANGSAGDRNKGDASSPGTPSSSHDANGPMSADPSAGGKDTVAQQEALARVLAGQDAAPDDIWSQAAELLKSHVTDLAYTMPYEQQADPSVNAAFMQQTAGDSARIAAALSGFVQSERQDRRAHTHRGRRVDTRKLHCALLGDTKVFLREQRREGVDTTIHVLLDLSESMKGGRDAVAKEAAMALALALDRIPGVTQALTVFPGKPIQVNGTYVPGVTRILARRENPRRISGTLAECRARGGTPMTEALYYAASRIMGASENRKTILVITDGEPNDVPSCKKAVQDMMRMGIEVCGIGIKTMSVQDLFPQYAVIRNVNELRDAIFTMARRILAPRAA